MRAQRVSVCPPSTQSITNMDALQRSAALTLTMHGLIMRCHVVLHVNAIHLHANALEGRDVSLAFR